MMVKNCNYFVGFFLFTFSTKLFRFYTAMLKTKIRLLKAWLSAIRDMYLKLKITKLYKYMLNSM